MPLVRKQTDRVYIRGVRTESKKIGGNLEFIKDAAIEAAKQYVMKNGVNMLINNLPFEAHLLDIDDRKKIRKYNYCGPGTKLGDPKHPGRLTFDKDGNVMHINTPPINKLDSACMNHDLAYMKKDIPNRNKADEILKEASVKFLQSNEARRPIDRINGNLVYQIMDYKIKNQV